MIMKICINYILVFNYFFICFLQDWGELVAQITAIFEELKPNTRL